MPRRALLRTTTKAHRQIVPQSPTSQNRPKSAQKAEITIPAPQQLRIMQRHIQGASARKIAREEGRARETVTKIVKSSEMHGYVQSLRERVYGLGDAALEAVEHTLCERRDGRVGYELLVDIGAVPSPNERPLLPAPKEIIAKESLNDFEQALVDGDDCQINPEVLKLVRMAEDRAKIYGLKLPTPEELRHRNMVLRAIDEATGGRSMELTLHSPWEWNRLEAIFEAKLAEFKELAQRKPEPERRPFKLPIDETVSEPAATGGSFVVPENLSDNQLAGSGDNRSRHHAGERRALFSHG